MKTKFIAHRGLSSLAPENSIKAFKLAASANFYGIETDIHSTKDFFFAVFHDQTLPRMTNNEGYIKDHNYKELRELKLTGGNFSNIYKEEYIPLLEEYLSICKDNDKVAILEIKEVSNLKLIDKVLEIIKRYNYINQTIIISFNLEYLKYLRRISNIQLQYLVNKFTEETIITLKKYHLDIDVNYKGITEENIKELKDNNILINIWTVDDIEMIKYFIDLEVDFITTNINYNMIK